MSKESLKHMIHCHNSHVRKARFAETMDMQCELRKENHLASLVVAQLEMLGYAILFDCFGCIKQVLQINAKKKAAAGTAA